MPGVRADPGRQWRRHADQFALDSGADGQPGRRRVLGLESGRASLTQAVRAERQAQGTRVIGVLPGYVDTAMNEGVSAPKMQPSEALRATLDALLTDEDDVF